MLPVIGPSIDNVIEILFRYHEHPVTLHSRSILKQFNFLYATFNVRNIGPWVQFLCVLCLFPIALPNGIPIWIIFYPRNTRNESPSTAHVIVAPVLLSL